MKFLAASIIDEKSKYASVCTKSVCIQHYLKTNNTKMIKMCHCYTSLSCGDFFLGSRRRL